MNDDRFKELLNLHLDHRLSAEEARELEQALRSDPERRRVFRGYALMQRGCAELFKRSAADAPAPDALVRALREAEARMSERSQRRAAVWGWSTWGATAGVAAVVTLLVARVSQPGAVAVQPSREDTSGSAMVASSTSSALSARGALPPHLTLAALGISPEIVESPSSVSRWQTADDSSRTESVPAWAQAGVDSAWPSAGVVQAQFSGRPINAWAGQSGPSGAHFQSASFTFER